VSCRILLVGPQSTQRTTACCSGSWLGIVEPWQRRSPLSWSRVAAALTVVAIAAILLSGLHRVGIEFTHPFTGEGNRSGPVPLGGWTASVAEFAVEGRPDWMFSMVVFLFGATAVLAVLGMVMSSSESSFDSSLLEPDRHDYPEVVVVATRRDEAAVGLRVLHVLGRVASVASRWLDRVYNGPGTSDGVPAFIVSVVLIGSVMSLWFLAIEGFSLARFGEVIVIFALTTVGAAGDEVVVGVALALGAGGIFATVLLLVVQLNTLSIGIDGYRASLESRFSVSRRPDWDHVFEEVALSGTSRGLRHSRLMEDPNAVATIVEHSLPGDFSDSS